MKTIIQQINDEIRALSPTHLHKVLVFAKTLRQIDDKEKEAAKA